MEILWPEAGAEPAEGEENSASLVLKVRWKDFDALLTGDLEGEGEQALLGRLGPCEYLKVAHHGSGNSTGKEFLDAVRPEICVISVPNTASMAILTPKYWSGSGKREGKFLPPGNREQCGLPRKTAGSGSGSSAGQSKIIFDRCFRIWYSISVMDSLYIIIPAYNEEANIGKVLDEWYPVVEAHPGAGRSRLVVVNDGSRDSNRKDSGGVRRRTSAAGPPE